jgi:large subunit ribosomal protein L7/L12
MGQFDLPSFVLGVVVALGLIVVIALLRRDHDPIRTGANVIQSAARSLPGIPNPGQSRPTFGGTSSTFGVTPTQQLTALIRGGRKIEAIKLYRSQTGVGLREAKDAVDAMELQMTRAGQVRR